MRKGYRVTLGVLTIMILFTLTIGTSYSYFSVSDQQSTQNDLTTTCFNVEFTQGDSIALNSAGNYAYPMTEEELLQLESKGKYKPYTFTIKNTCTAENSNEAIKYDITLNTLAASSGVPASTLTNSLSYKLNMTSTNGTSTVGTQNNLIQNVYPLGSELKAQHQLEDSYLLESGTLAPQEKKSFTLYLWIKADACDGNDCEEKVMGRLFNGKVLIYNHI